MSLIQKLQEGNIDIVGDVHGEFQALLNLLLSLGYDNHGNHPDNRKLVFVGDLCDRGPDSPRVILFVKNLVEKGNAQVVLGNHELNILQNKPKPGTGWYFSERLNKDSHYMPFEVVSEKDKETIYKFLEGLPIALERDDLRVVHAAWIPQAIEKVRSIPLGQVINEYWKLENSINDYIQTSGLLKAYREEENKYKEQLEDPKAKLPFLEITSEYNMAHQMMNPLRMLTSGLEQKATEAFYAGAKWRFVERCTWWNEYKEDVPVIIGHFWRKMNDEALEKTTENNVFEGVGPLEWHGAKNNVFCVDYSVGGRFIERQKEGVEPGENTVLAALRWPENELVLETGEKLKTVLKENSNKTIKLK